MPSVPRLRRSLPVALLSVLLAATGCASSGGNGIPMFQGGTESVEWQGLRWEVTLEKTPPDRIRVRGRVVNISGVRRRALIPQCLAWIRVYHGGRLVFDRDEDGHENCEGFKRQLNLPPGGQETEVYGVTVEELLGEEDPSGFYMVRTFIPREDRFDQGLRTAMELTVGRVFLQRPGDELEPSEVLDRILALPGLPWGTPATEVRARLTSTGFTEVRPEVEGSLFFSGASLLDHNAGIIARVPDGTLVKLVGLMEPSEGDDPETLARDFDSLVNRLRARYGPESESRGDPGDPQSLEAAWIRAPVGDRVYAIRLSVTAEGLIRLDAESAEWETGAADPRKTRRR